MINKLISKSQVALLEYEGNPSQAYKDGYTRAINDVLDIEPVPSIAVDEIEKMKEEYEKAWEDCDVYDPDSVIHCGSVIDKIIEKYTGVRI